MANTIQGLGIAVISFVVLAIVLGIGGIVLSEVKDTQCEYTLSGTNQVCVYCENSTYYTVNTSDTTCIETANTSTTTAVNYSEGTSFNATTSGLEGISTFGEWLPTIAVILASALIIGIVSAYFYFKG